MLTYFLYAPLSAPATSFKIPLVIQFLGIDATRLFGHLACGVNAHIIDKKGGT
jgi:hypothetical protein